MFDDQNQNATSTEPAAAAPAEAAAAAPSAPTLSDPMVTPTTTPPQPQAGINGVSLENAYIEPAPQIGPAKPAEPENVPTAASMITSSATAPADNSDLAQLKQQALQSLEPLVEKLDQAPEEKFKTVMMLVQSSDNSKLLKTAYDAASQITDERVRAQALLDVVNEINYLTAQTQNKQ